MGILFKKDQPQKKKLESFFDFNYEPVLFDIRGVDKDELKMKLKIDYINHIWEVDDVDYIAINNCDVWGYPNLDDIFLDVDESILTIYKLEKDGDGDYTYISNGIAMNCIEEGEE